MVDKTNLNSPFSNKRTLLFRCVVTKCIKNTASHLPEQVPEPKDLKDIVKIN